VERPALDRLGKRLGIRVDTKIYDIDDFENYRLLLAVEKDLGDEDNEFPVVVVGDKLLGGNEEIEEGLEGAIKEAIAAGETGLPDVVERLSGAGAADDRLAVDGKPVYAAFFSQGGCASCDRVARALEFLEKKYPSLECRTYDTREAEEAVLLEAVCDKSSVPEEDRGRNPAIFVGGKYLLGEDVKPSAIESLLGESIETGTDRPWEVTDAELVAARDRILGRFRGLKPMTVIAAGLIDGINPCAFATIVFFVTYLAATGRGSREATAVGLVFAAAVFATYSAVGLGALGAIVKLRAYSTISGTIDAVAGSAALLFGVLSLADYLKARRGRIDEMSLVLPGFLKKRINLNISKQVRLRGIVLGAFVAGVLVSVFELACTGQVYLPTLALVTGDPALRARMVFYLLIYNVMFILPLLVILGLTHFGLSSQTLAGFFKKRIAASKLALAILFLAIGAVVLGNLWL
jgi:cytochrome c biogenesis protein CcdA/thiol-disulfide isomerase/thioredoxin